MYPIYCINLQTRIDRKQHSKEQFLKLNIPLNSVIFPPFEKDLSGGVYGCFRSHMSIWNDFLINHPNSPYCLIFEDDFLINTENKECIQVLKDATKFLDSHPADILHLHNICIPFKKSDEQFQQGYGVTTHAYFVTRSYIERIFQSGIPQADGTHIDINFSFKKQSPLYSQNIYYSNKLFFSQYVSSSDNYNCTLDSLLRIDHIGMLCIGISFLNTLKSYELLTNSNIQYLVYCMHDIFVIPPSKEKTQRIVNEWVQIFRETNLSDIFLGYCFFIFHYVLLYLFMFIIIFSKIDSYYFGFVGFWFLLLFTNYYFHGCLFTRIEREFFGPSWKGDTEYFLNKVLKLNLSKNATAAFIGCTLSSIFLTGLLRIFANL